jgi:hypothetical protein
MTQEAAAEIIMPDIDQAMRDGQAVFDGTADVEPGGGESGEPAGIEQHPAQAGPAAAPPPAGTENPAAAGTEPPAAERPRFTSHEEAEKGYKNLQREKTLLEQRLQKMEQEQATAQQAEALRAEQAARDQQFIDYAAERNTRAIDEIDQLDPDAPDYKKQVALCWARANLDIRNHEKEHGAGAPAAKPKPTENAGPPSGGADNSRDTEAESVRQAVGDILAKDHGMDRDDPVFWFYAQRTPDKDAAGKALTLAEQIQAAVQQTQAYHDAIIQKRQKADADAASKKGQEAQLRDLPMGRSVSEQKAPDPGVENRPVSLTDAVESALEQRRL